MASPTSPLLADLPLLVARQIRVHQWSKNLLVVLPLLAAHQLGDARKVSAGALAFVAFCLCASAGYVLNDLIDLESDRQHPVKSQRPLAGGHLSIGLVAAVGAGFAVAAAAVAAVLGTRFAVLLGTYFATSLAYSTHLKRVVVLDVVVLTGLYTLRIIAGAVAVDVPLSSWMLTFSLFLFLSLALLKRSADLHRHGGSSGALAGREYVREDADVLARLGMGSGYLSVLVLALYLQSGDVAQLYSHPQLLWLLCPVLLYWMTRVWFLAHRGAIHVDPVVFALKDPVSYVCAVVSGAIIVGAV